MPLQKQKIPLQLGQGIDTKTDPKQVVPGKLVTLENATLETTKSFKKTAGYTQLATLSETSEGFGILGDDLLAFGNETVNIYSPSEGDFVQQPNNSFQATSAKYRAAQISIQQSIANMAQAQMFDSCIHSNGVKVTAWGDPTINNIYYQSFDSETNASFVPASSIFSNGTNAPSGIKTIAIGNNILIFFVNTATSMLTYFQVDVTNPTVISGPNVITTALTPASPTFDLCLLGTTAYLAISTPGATISVCSISSSLVFSAFTSLAGCTATNGLTISGDSILNQLWLAFGNGTDVSYLVLSTAFATVLARTVIEVTAASENIGLVAYNGTARIFYDHVVPIAGTPLVLYNNFTKRCLAQSNGINSTITVMRSVSVISKPFLLNYNGTLTAYVLVGYSGTLQGYAFLINDVGNIICKIGQDGVAAGYLYNTIYHQANTLTTSAPPEVHMVSTSSFSIPYLQQDFAYSSDNTVHALYGVSTALFDFASELNYQSEVTSNNLHITGGFLSMYDGLNFVEHSFLINPEPPTVSSSSYDSSTNNFENGKQYAWVVVFEWLDNKGNFHQSAPGPAVLWTAPSNKTTVVLSVPTLRITNKTNVVLSLYRTEGNGTVYFRISATPLLTTSGVSPNANSTTADTISVSDSASDSTIIGYQELYTNGGEVENSAAPTPKSLFTYKNRLFVVPSETPNTIWYSKSALQGIPGVPTEFSVFLQQQINTLGGEVSCGMQIDDKAVLFKPTTIFYFVGDGPTANGLNNDFTPAVQLPVDVGCDNPRSLVLTPMGIIFQSLKGWYLLNRSLTAEYIGAAVEEFNSSVTLSAKLVPETREVRFLLDSGQVLSYDYYLNQWSVFTNVSGLDAKIYGDEYTYFTSSGALMQETPGVFSNNGAYISMKAKTGWLNFSGIQGFQRVYKILLLGDYVSDHTLTVNVYYDFSPYPQQTVTLNAGATQFNSDLYGSGTPYGQDPLYGGNYIPYQYRVFTNIQKCETIQVEVYDSSNGTIGEGFRLSNIAFEVGVEGGLMRVPAAQSTG